MKKILLLFVLLLGYSNISKAEPLVTCSSSLSAAPNMYNYWGYLEGYIGGDNQGMLFLDGKKGWYRFMGYERKVKMSSYNRSTGKLILKAYDKSGKYVGQFVGICIDDYSYGVRYRGTFTNSKGGKVEFNLVQTFVGD